MQANNDSLPLDKEEQASWAIKEKLAEDSLRSDQQRREKERLEYELAERQRKIEEREEAERQRQEAERLAYYAKLDSLNYSLLSLENYPKDPELFAARRSRTLWYLILGLALFLFLLSLFKFTYAWVGGIAGGLAFIVWFTHGLKIINFFPSLTNYSYLIGKRRKLKRELLEYIMQLEGSKGFMHRLFPLVEYNSRLATKRYKRLAMFSLQGQLMANLRTLEDTEAYYNFMLEARKGYKEMLLAKQNEEQLAAANAAAAPAAEEGQLFADPGLEDASLIKQDPKEASPAASNNEDAGADEDASQEEKAAAAKPVKEVSSSLELDSSLEIPANS